MTKVNSFNQAETLAANVKRLREAAGITQTELSTHASMAKHTIGQIERGKGNPSASNLLSLSLGLKCTVNDLLYPEGATSDTDTVQDSVHFRSYKSLPEGYKYAVRQLTQSLLAELGK